MYFKRKIDDFLLNWKEDILHKLFPAAEDHFPLSHQWTTPTYRSRSFLLQPLLRWLRCYATQCLTQCPQAY